MRGFRICGAPARRRACLYSPSRSCQTRRRQSRPGLTRLGPFPDRRAGPGHPDAARGPPPRASARWSRAALDLESSAKRSVTGSPGSRPGDPESGRGRCRSSRRGSTPEPVGSGASQPVLPGRGAASGADRRCSARADSFPAAPGSRGRVLGMRRAPPARRGMIRPGRVRPDRARPPHDHRGSAPPARARAGRPPQRRSEKPAASTSRPRTSGRRFSSALAQRSSLVFVPGAFLLRRSLDAMDQLAEEAIRQVAEDIALP